MDTKIRKHRRLMGLFGKLGVSNDQRHDLVSEFTKGRTQSTKDLYTEEVDELLAKLQRLLPENEHKASEELFLRRKRSVVLKIATSCDIHDTDNWQKFNEWMLRSSILHKPLNMYDSDELDALISQMCRLRDNYERSAMKFGNKAWWHKNGKIAHLN